MDSKQEKNLEFNLLSLLERSSKFSKECLTRLSKKPEAQDFASRLAKANPTIFASTLEQVVLSDLLEFVPMLEKILQATKFQHGVQLDKAQQEAADAKLAQDLAAREQEGERAAKRRRISIERNDAGRRSLADAVDNATAHEDRSGGRETAGRMSRGSSVSSGGSRASSRSRSPDEEARMARHPSVPIETGESSRTAALRSNEPDATDSSLFLDEEDLELAITTAAPLALARVKETWDNLGDPREFRRRKFHCDREQDMVLSYVIKLDIFILGPAVSEHLSRRSWIMSQSEHQPSVAEMTRLATSQETPPFQRFKALKGMTCAGKHDWIQRVYGEILLWESVQAEVERRSDAILASRPNSKLFEHRNILKNMAEEAAYQEGYRKQKDIDRFTKQFERHFSAGHKWRNVAKDFKGSGIIIAFIVAGTTSSDLYWE